METRANYVLIGAFTLAGFVGLLLFSMWFARIELDRQYAYYDIEFTSVSGLSAASEVRFSGLPVGQVVDVRLSPDASGRILVRIEIGADTPVRTGTIATIESLGVTGVAHVALSAGDPGNPLLQPAPGQDVPVISSGRSTLQTLTEDAPQIVEEVLALTRQLGEFLGPDNQARVGTILENLERSSGDLGRALDDFSAVTDTIASSSGEIAAFTGRLEAISAAAVQMLETADDTLLAVTDLAGRAQMTLDAGDATLESGRAALEAADLFIRNELPRLASDLTEAAEGIRRQIDTLGADAQATLAEFRRTGTLASARLAEAEATLAATDTMLADASRTLDSIDTAARRFDGFLANDGTALVTEARGLIAEAGRGVAAVTSFAETDLPDIVADIRTASETAARVVDEVGADLSSAAGRLDSVTAEASDTLGVVSNTFQNANQTLERLNAALETGDAALAAADRAFATADRVMTGDIADMAGALRETLARVDAAIAQVADDMPVITGDLRETAARANAAFDEVERTAASLGPPLRAFAGHGLPEFATLAQEMRELVRNLDRLVTRIERDPVEFLGRQTPVYRR
ncbi:phospholipid/cholesterol/gamma-HCH transport system substrate-binding protein [Rhodovulum bhavnagarense]|uniref:Phospholipid/cholesterol/gamma-HCH transport system substrate-binding protein n=1 Tax=Rhodovulum bhavnagarense TaxID=992286 RepID=A0A4R2RHM9_9RHOB|nr:MlaD family protein [Rhodovulum bhavnagarense]TCP61647.1 phospholipid/cholesterol/gamma-HCH transport system substrate-binding protein [Rhodovulum bhavnagarense]